jgi:two-component system, chemotaxis family, protein-glutamate methylesterase/glutaminase
MQSERVMIRVLVVDDSAFIRKVISRILEKDQTIQVVGTADNGAEALEKIEALHPDVVTMDVEMPRMNGIEALKKIMSTKPLPVIMLSGVTKEGANITLDALNMGACDFITKDSGNAGVGLFKIEDELLRKVKDVARRRVRMPAPKPQIQIHKRPVVERIAMNGEHEIVSMGASTGGPPALQHILTSLSKSFPVPLVIAQHMPKLFTQSFAERLNSLSQITVKEAENREPLKPGVALIAPGDSHMAVRRKGKETFVELVADDHYIYRPSVDLLMDSVARAYEAKVVAVILTGMGSDGLAGFREIRSRHGYVIAQDEETCVVYGMPRVVIEAQLAHAVLPIQKIPEEIIRVL